MDATDYWAMTDTERSAFADLADSLTPAQWDQPSLCNGWKVRDVVSHVTDGSMQTLGKSMLILAKYGFRMNTMIEREAQKGGAHPTDELRKGLRTTVGVRKVMPPTKPAEVVMETIVHQQDVRRPLGIKRDYPADELKVSLDCAATMGNALVPGKKRIARLHLRATDVDWEHGEGDEVAGPGEALLMAMAGRPAAFPDLKGPGVETLRSRVK